MNSKRLLSTAVAACLLACDASPPAPADSTPVRQSVTFVDDIPNTTEVYGYSWDIELFLVQLMMCGPDCADLAFLFFGNPLWDYAMLAGSEVQMYQLDDTWSAVGEPTGTGPEGVFYAGDLPAHYFKPYYYPSSTGGDYAIQTDPSDPFYQGPAPTFLPTLTLRPIDSNYFPTCAGVESVAISDSGIAEAIAKHLTLGGVATTAADLVDPLRFGGVAIFMLIYPGDPVLRYTFGADNTTVTASEGTVLNIGWAPPGMLPPEAQSARGFYVDTSVPSPIGLTAVVLPPERTGVPITIQRLDTMDDPSQGRPWTLPEMTLPLISGKITFGPFPLQAAPDTSPRAFPVYPSEEVYCYPSTRGDRILQGFFYNEL